MTKQLTTQNATITTASVEIKSLTISGKQVTLAVFRQLQEEPLIADDGTLKGVPWGAINYHPDKCGDDRRQHWHIVWQRGQELRRSRVDQTPRFDPDGHFRRVPAEFHSEEAHDLLTSSVLEWLDGRRPDCPLSKKQYASKHNDEMYYRTGRGFTAYAWASTTAVEAADKRTEVDSATRSLNDCQKSPSWPRSEEQAARDLQQRGERLAEAEAAFAGARAELAAEVATWGLTHEQLLDAFHQACQAEAARRQRHRDVRATLAQLPQLFIAV